MRADRLDFRPKHRLTVLVVQASPLVEPLRLARAPEYAGCKSWVPLPVDPTWAAPVHDDATLQKIAERVRHLSRLTAEASGPRAAPVARCRPRRGARCAWPTPAAAR